MKSIVVTLLLIIPVLSMAQEVCLSTEEKKLYDMIMAYRKSKQLKGIPYSAKLTRVAQAHVRDLAAHFDYMNRGECNPHSWSDQGNWTACCYTDDHAKAECMWNKPKEISGYEGEGFEIAYFSSGGASALEGLDGWKKSPGHNPLLINSGQWKELTWKGMGVGIFEQYGVVWFGKEEDKSKIQLCK